MKFTDSSSSVSYSLSRHPCCYPLPWNSFCETSPLALHKFVAQAVKQYKSSRLVTHASELTLFETKCESDPKTIGESYEAVSFSDDLFSITPLFVQINLDALVSYLIWKVLVLTHIELMSVVSGITVFPFQGHFAKL